MASVGAAKGEDGARTFLRVCSAASAVAAACLVVLAFLPRPPFPYDHGRIISGAQVLSPGQVGPYTDYLEANLAFDGVYLLGHLLTWVGYAAVLRGQRRPAGAVAGAVVAAVGLLSGGLDLLENSVRWVVVGGLEDGFAGPAVGAAWGVVVEMSFWATYVAAVVAGAAVLGRGRWGLLAGSVGLLCVPAALALYPTGFFYSFLWLIAWQATSAAFLWVAAGAEGPG